MNYQKQFLMISIVLLLVGTFSVFGQDTLTVDVNTGGINIDIKEIITGDTLANGDRVNPDRVYKLKRGGRYLFSGTIVNDGYHLKIVGENTPAEVAPPIIMRQVDELGESPAFLFEAQGDLTLKNMYFLNVDVNSVPRNFLKGLAADIDLNIDNCVIHYFGSALIDWVVDGSNMTITNNYFRNVINPKAVAPFARFFWTKGAQIDSMMISNNTFLNCQFGLLMPSNKDAALIPNYISYEHNTIVNVLKQPFHGAFWREFYLKNNLFINPIVTGDAINNRNQDSDFNPFAVVWIDSINSPDIMAETDRIIQLSHNNYWTQPELLAQQINDTLTNPIKFLNERDSLICADNVTWPGITIDYSTTTQEDPGLMSRPWHLDSLLKAADWMRESPWPGPIDLTFDTDNDRLTIDWPISEDLGYTNTALLTASSEGLPLGDLFHWFPDKYNEWLVTDIDVEQNTEIPAVYSLSQNYPNPFNPTTNIKFSVPERSLVNLSIYNVLGQMVANLVNSELKAGNHTVKLNANNLSSGIYFYTLKSNNSAVITKKMMLIK